MTSPNDANLTTKLFTSVDGVFYRSIDPRSKSQTIAGSRFAGRYSSDEQPTLYLSSSYDGVAAALMAHSHSRSEQQEIVEIHVAGEQIFDLRNQTACAAAHIKLEDAISPWQQLVAQGKRPPSWRVRDKIIALGGKGLIDPSRQKPGLWHLVLFEWNSKTSPSVKVVA